MTEKINFVLLTHKRLETASICKILTAISIKALAMQPIEWLMITGRQQTSGDWAVLPNDLVAAVERGAIFFASPLHGDSRSGVVHISVGLEAMVIVASIPLRRADLVDNVALARDLLDIAGNDSALCAVGSELELSGNSFSLRTDELEQVNFIVDRQFGTEKVIRYVNGEPDTL